MSERQIPDPQSTPQAPASVDASAPAPASTRRRRLLKLGVGTVPAAMTLASRPVMAWNCNTASTWGSAQGVAQTNSSYVRSRQSVRLFTDETYTADNWKNCTTRAGLPAPWTTAPMSRTAGTSDTALATSTHYKNFTVADLFSKAGASGASIQGVSTDDTVWSILNGSAQKIKTSVSGKTKTYGTFVTGSSSCTDFQRLMLTAWLNYVQLRSSLTQCLLSTSSNNVLVALGAGTYTDVKGKKWGQTEAIVYLKKNYISCSDDSSNSCGPTAL